jgi:hypothetical protein
MPGYQPNYSTWLKTEMGLEFPGGGVNKTYIGEAYSNFGILFSLMLAYVLGATFQFIYYAMLKYKAGAVVALLVSISLKSIISSGIVTPIIYQLIPFIFTYLFYRTMLLIIGSGCWHLKRKT